MTIDHQKLRALVTDWRKATPTDRSPSYILDDLCPQVIALLDEVERLRSIAADVPDWLSDAAASKQQLVDAQAQIATMHRGYRDLHDMLPGNKDVWSKVADLQAQHAAAQAECERLLAEAVELRDSLDSVCEHCQDRCGHMTGATP